MIDWLRRDPAEPTVAIGGRTVPIAIRRHAQARRLTMRLAPDGSAVRVTLPRWGRTLDAVAFAESRRDWLEGQLAALPRPAPAVPGGTLAYRGALLRIEWDARHHRTPVLAGEALQLGGAQEAVSTRLRRWLEAEALRLNARDLAHYCTRAGVPLPTLHLSRAQRRWGSCSQGQRTQPAVRINWRLVQSPDWVRGSVVAHEVAHLVHFDHSAAFHALLAGLYDGDLPAADRWLKEQGRSLYAAFG